jgi:hypothetical protein
VHGASNGNVSLLHSGDPQIRISDGTLIILTEDFRSFPQSLKANAVIVLSRVCVTIDGIWICEWIY